MRSAAALLVLVSATAASGEVAGGRVTDGAGPIQRARVLVFDPATGQSFEDRTDFAGRWAVQVPPGTWRVGASVRDRAYVETGLVVPAGGLGMQDFVLPPETEPGSWAVVGDTFPEEFGGSNSAVLLSTGRVLYCHDTRDPMVYDPSTRACTPGEDSSTFQGCSAVTLLEGGAALFVGGQRSFTFTDSTNQVKAFDSTTETWDDPSWPDLNVERWYPGLARLADGGLLACGGGQRPAAARTDTCEVMDPVTRAWRMTSVMSQPSEYSPMALLHEGEVLKTWWPPERFDPATEAWSPAAMFAQPDRTYPDHCDHALVVLRDGRALAVGASRICPDPMTCSCCPDPNPAVCSGQPPCPPLVMAEFYDPCADEWRTSAGNAAVGRYRGELAQLPDGRMFWAAGQLSEPTPGVPTNSQDFTKLVDLYDPATERFRPVTDMRVFREYHAMTMLMPDARVLVTAGTGQVGQQDSPDTLIDAYSPPYLFRGPRPVIDAISTTTLVRGQSFTLDVSRAPVVTSVVLIGAQAVTHYIDGAVPRRLALPFFQQGTVIEARMPEGQFAAPPGWYLLFVMVDDVPSDGRIVFVPAAAPLAAPDAIGGALRVEKAGVGQEDVWLEWRTGPLNPARYLVYRATIPSTLAVVPGVIDTVAPLTGVEDEVFVDRGAAAPGTPRLYCYRILGRQCDGTPILAP
jgi:hypothetical protein